MLKNVCVAMVMLLSVTAVFAGDDSAEARKKAAQAYVKDVSPRDMVDDAVKNISERIPEENREWFKQFMLKEIDWNKVTDVTVDALAKVYTVEEIQAMHTFYSSDLGRSVQKKFGAYMAEIMMPLQGEIQRAVMKSMEELNTKNSAETAKPKDAHEGHDNHDGHEH